MQKRHIFFISLGCAKNKVDTECILGLAQAIGWQLATTPDEADIILINTCGFIDEAKQESVDTILEMAEYKKLARCPALVVIGCLAQKYAKDLATEIPEIDHIFGTADFIAIRRYLSQTLTAPELQESGTTGIDVTTPPTALYNDVPRILTGQKHSAYLKIAEGCDRLCAFCNIPQLRGRLRSRSIDSIVEEAKQLIEQGVVELNLVAQDTTQYGRDLRDRNTRLQKLLDALVTLEVPWIRIHYTYPTGVTDDIIRTIANEPRILNYVDVPVQHVSDDVLRAMRRGHSSKKITDLVSRLRDNIPDVVLRTTLIVGHPGETEKDFEELVEFVQLTAFDHIGVFTFSPQPDTLAADLPQPLSQDIIDRRRDIILQTQAAISTERNQGLIGNTLEVLVDGESDESEFLLKGRWYGQAPEVDGIVHLTDGTADAGQFVRATVTDASTYDLVASLDPDDDNASG